MLLREIKHLNSAKKLALPTAHADLLAFSWGRLARIATLLLAYSTFAAAGQTSSTAACRFYELRRPYFFDNLALPTALHSVMGDNCTKIGQLCDTARCEQGNWSNARGEFIHHVVAWQGLGNEGCATVVGWHRNAVTHTPLSLLMMSGLKHQFVKKGKRCNE